MRLPEGDPFQALADPSRRAIIDLLSKNKKTINALAENFEMSRPAVSKHVKILTAAGFIFIEDIGRERYCSLNADGFNAVHDWISYYEQFWTVKLQALDKFLGNQKHGRKKKKR